MELRADDLAAYIRRIAPGRPDALDRLRAAVERGDRDLANTRVAHDESGELSAALHLNVAGPTTLILAGPFFGEDDVVASLLPEVLERADELGATIVRTRPRAAQLGPRYRAALLANGFRELGERVEFKTPVADLPLDDGTPLTWRDLDEAGRDLAAEMLARVAVGDPHSDPENEDPHEAIADWLGAPALTHGPDCLQIGYRDGAPVAFVCAQVRPDTGWARVTYMGVAPEARGQGLGAWVHKHGFRMLLDQGGKLYHSGTSTANAAMLRLFETHGCVEVDRMFEFERRV
jgi:GNAT superfamily N-acetyltransferase